jgi:PAS domain-containing protein
MKCPQPDGGAGAGDGGEACETAEYCHQPSGTTFLIAHQRIADAQQLPLGVSLVLVDITSRIEAEKQLRERETHFRTVLQLGPNVTWRAGPDGLVDYMGNSSIARQMPVIRNVMPAGWHAWIPMTGFVYVKPG